MGTMVTLDVSDVEDIEESKNECYEKIERESSFDNSSPSSEYIVEENSTDENNSKNSECYNGRDNNISSCKIYSDNERIRESGDCSLAENCSDSAESECSSSSGTTIATTGGNSVSRRIPEQRAISVRDKILQDFCDDVSQELNIGSDLITLVKHSACSPRSTPQRLPSSDLKQPIWPSSILTPPSDILSTRNSESSHNNQDYCRRNKRPVSPQPSTSNEWSNVSVTSINSPLHTLFISPSPSSCCSPRLMSPPIVTQFRHPSPRKRANLNSPPLPPPPPPPPNLTTAISSTTITVQPRTRASHKLNLEAEKAYEFTDDAQETCEKLSSFRKRRLADKKYEFRDEAEDTENIVPFKHMRDQFKHHRHCSGHRLSSRALSLALSNNRWPINRYDSDQSETDDVCSVQDCLNYNEYQYSETGKFERLLDFCWFLLLRKVRCSVITHRIKIIIIIFPAEKSVLRPINQNQLSNGNTARNHYGKCYDATASPLVPRVSLDYPTIKCTAHFKRSYIELDDEMISVITDVEGLDNNSLWMMHFFFFFFFSS